MTGAAVELPNLHHLHESVLRLVACLADSLEPSGAQLVGASESLLRFGTVFDCEEHAGAFFYRKSR